MTDDVATAIREDGGRVLAVLARSLGDLQLAEDALQDATIAALEVWPRTGVPSNPGGWLYVAARRKALDSLRSDRRRADRHHRTVTGRPDVHLDPELPDDSTIADDQLRLLFTICHPALAIGSQVALALRLVVGLSTHDVADALLVSEATMTRRLTRARDKIRAAAIGGRLPAPTEIERRTAGVLAVVHLVYTAGHSASGVQLVRTELCAEGIRLARLVCRLLPGEASPEALLALLLLTDARRPTRLDADGVPVTLEEQDRSKWDHDAIAEGVELLGTSLERSDGVADPYQLQAAIAAAHSVAPSFAAVDWSEIVRLYGLLRSVHANPAVDVSFAVALAHRDGPGAGLDALHGVPDAARGHRWHLAHGELAARAGRVDVARASLEQARSMTRSAPERDAISRRIELLSA